MRSTEILTSIRPFDKDAAAGWFYHVEAVFRLNDVIGDQQRCDYIVAKMDIEMLTALNVFLRELSTDTDYVEYVEVDDKNEKYNCLKNEILRKSEQPAQVVANDSSSVTSASEEGASTSTTEIDSQPSQSKVNADNSVLVTSKSDSSKLDDVLNQLWLVISKLDAMQATMTQLKVTPPAAGADKSNESTSRKKIPGPKIYCNAPPSRVNQDTNAATSSMYNAMPDNWADAYNQYTANLLKNWSFIPPYKAPYPGPTL